MKTYTERKRLGTEEVKDSFLGTFSTFDILSEDGGVAYKVRYGQYSHTLTNANGDTLLTIPKALGLYGFAGRSTITDGAGKEVFKIKDSRADLLHQIVGLLDTNNNLVCGLTPGKAPEADIDPNHKILDKIGTTFYNILDSGGRQIGNIELKIAKLYGTVTFDETKINDEAALALLILVY